MIHFEPREMFDKAIIKTDENKNVNVYSYSKLIDVLVDSPGFSLIEAIDYIEFNMNNVAMKGWPVIEDDFSVSE